jgi:hypothetical protein
MNRSDPGPEEIRRLESRLEDAILGGGENTDDGQAAARVLGKVRGYVRSTPPATARGWSSRLLVITAIAAPATVAAALALAVITGQFQKAVVPVPAGSPVPSPLASPQPSPSPATTVELVLVESSSPAGSARPLTIHWDTTGGRELASKQLPDNEAVIGAAGSRVLIYRNDGHVIDLHMDGTSEDVGSGLPTNTSPGPTDVPVRVLVSPDGSRWIWSEMVGMSGSMVTSRIWESGVGATPRIAATAVEDQHSLRPYAWTLANPLITHGAIGVGGYYVLDPSFGQVDVLELATGKQTPVGPADEIAAAVAGNGAIAYMAPHGQIRLLTVNGPGQRGLSANLPSTGQAAGLLFDPGSNHVVFATSPAQTPGQEQVETDIVDLTSSGARTNQFAPAGTRPAAWTPDGRLVVTRASGFAGGPTGTYLVSIDTTVVQVSSYFDFIGLNQLTVAAP